MIRLIKLLFVSFASSYKILESVTPVFPKVIEPCQGISKRLLGSSVKVCDKLTEIGYPVMMSSDNSTGSICNEKHREHYGYMMSYENFTEIHISNKLLTSPNTLYNVVLHEVLHSVGLHHSSKEGMMKYAVSKNWWGEVIEDQRELWLSIDDLSGLYYISTLASD